MTEAQIKCLNVVSLTELMKQFSKYEIFSQAAEYCHNRYNFQIEVLTPSDALQLGRQIVDRQYERSNRKLKQTTTDGITVWAAGEQKLLSWLAVCFCYINKIDINKLNKSNMKSFQTIFTDKAPEVLIYEVRNKITSNTKNKKQWSAQEQNVLVNIMEMEHKWARVKNNFKWKFISFQLFLMTQLMSFKSARQCRQKWTNYLDPTVKKAKWTKEQDTKLFETMHIYGSRWSIIAKELNCGRTENMVKNRAIAVLKKVLKRPVKNLTKIHLQILKASLNKSQTDDRSFRSTSKCSSLIEANNRIIVQEESNMSLQRRQGENNPNIREQTSLIVQKDKFQTINTFLPFMNFSRPLKLSEEMLVDQILALPSLGYPQYSNLRIQNDSNWEERQLFDEQEYDLFLI